MQGGRGSNRGNVTSEESSSIDARKVSPFQCLSLFLSVCLYLSLCLRLSPYTNARGLKLCYVVEIDPTYRGNRGECLDHNCPMRRMSVSFCLTISTRILTRGIT